MGTQQTTKLDRILEDIRRRILSNEYPRGARLRQDELARELSTSITPVREALRVLEAEGLLVSEPHKGVRVAGLDLERTKAIYIVRRLVESYAMRRAAMRISPLDLARAREIHARMRSALDDGDAGAFQTLNRDFHFHFYERCGMPALHDQIAGMWRAFPWDVSLDSLDRGMQSMEEHGEILESVASNELDRVALATEHHIAQGFLALVERATSQHISDPFELDHA